ncbi:transcriptional regulator, ArsR family protein, partial [mine drainage metagenome]
VQRALDLGWGETAYHLDQLVRHGVLRRERTGRRDSYFDREVSWEDRRILAVLRGGRVRYLLLELTSAPDLGFAELQRRLGVSKSTLSFHLTRLIAGGVVESVQGPEGRRYRLLHRDRVAQLVRSYRESFEDRLIDGFIETWSSLLPE